MKNRLNCNIKKYSKASQGRLEISMEYTPSLAGAFVTLTKRYPSYRLNVTGEVHMSHAGQAISTHYGHSCFDMQLSLGL